ncbi:SAM-dependent methyltransferase [Mycobacterium sp. CBMA 234]|uniref:SAM-dependent methyltransferase n=1 Tax=Mycolicibacterium sp. CBMA 234 TaxID=1918495 RepID=UPI0012DDB767|nr:SAM-dependent methyltransferase [Mycolicibacterium sp. CBMA 234]MUL66431.1 SAM-dependent methyltransferase [Mycolicibacterium sp. CBMA 234]
MARTDDDSWDITESVGATALGVAAARAAETATERPLFEDPCAQIFVEAATERGWSSPFTAADPGPAQAARMRMLMAYVPSRTKWFDEFFASAGADSILQVVILAAGLDARAWRLPWLDGTVVFEIDQPMVLAFKEDTLAAHGVQPAARHVAVPIDLRQDWPEALRQAGFDSTRPTAWLTEGLLPYLPAEAQYLLFDRIHELSAPGSRIAVESFGPEYFSEAKQRVREERMAEVRAEAVRTGKPTFDISELVYVEPREDVAEWLTRHGWQTTVETSAEVTARYKPQIAGDVPDLGSEFVDGKLV